MFRRLIFWTALSFLMLFAFGAATVLYLWFTPYGKGEFPKGLIVEPGTSLQQVSKSLEEEGLIRSGMLFLALALIKGDQGRIKAGEYRFSVPLSPMDLLEILSRGEVVLHPVTIPEGWTVKQIAEKLEQEGLVDAERFIKKAMDPKFASTLLGFSAPSLEGFMFPDTYHFSLGWSEERIIRVMVRRFKSVFDQSMMERARQIGFSILQVVSLASLIEKETALPKERPIISGVFHRRLMLGMRLESDPSVIYGMADFDGNLTKEDLSTPHPYNTYLINGLPPGPICNPGRESIIAALYPSDEGYLYFVSKNDGSHHFSKTYRAHLRAVLRYQIKGNQR